MVEDFALERLMQMERLKVWIDLYIMIVVVNKEYRKASGKVGYHHLFIVGEVHSLFPCPPSQGMPCNYPLFDPSSLAVCQEYCPSHSSLYASHQDCVATRDPPNTAR